MKIETLLVIMGIHFIADFILQSDWMAKNKSCNNLALLSHVIVYTGPFIVIGWEYAMVNMVLHALVDYFSSRAAKYLYPRSIHWFFVIIGLDQYIHLVCLVVSYKMMFG